MIKRVRARSRKWAKDNKRYIEVSEIPIISVGDKAFPPVFGNTENSIDLYVDDLNGMTAKQAEQIIRFVDRINKRTDKHQVLYVHCVMGVSRSGAIAKFINEYLELDKKTFYEENEQIHPNGHIYKVLVSTQEKMSR